MVHVGVVGAECGGRREIRARVQKPRFQELLDENLNNEKRARQAHLKDHIVRTYWPERAIYADDWMVVKEHAKEQLEATEDYSMDERIAEITEKINNREFETLEFEEAETASTMTSSTKG